MDNKEEDEKYKDIETTPRLKSQDILMATIFNLVPFDVPPSIKGWFVSSFFFFFLMSDVCGSFFLFY